MGQKLKSDECYNHEMLHDMTEAFEYVWDCLNRIGYPQFTRTIIADHILDLVLEGERDPDIIAALTLERFVRASTRPCVKPTISIVPVNPCFLHKLG